MIGKYKCNFGVYLSKLMHLNGEKYFSRSESNSQKMSLPTFSAGNITISYIRYLIRY